MTSPFACSGTCVFRSHNRHQRPCSRLITRLLLAEKLCDSEVQQLHFAVGGHQDIARLQVAMHDQPLVSVLNRIADGAEQFETLGDVQLAFVAPAINRLAVDELHHEVRKTLFGSGGVQEPGNPGMIERRQNLALLPESRQNIRAHSFPAGRA